ncbi:MAG: hypothetical protein PHR35_12805, partial [Kiritimatiellae bacterium]|nr:hypothetical protein [Kiritimatiellia bacterium]
MNPRIAASQVVTAVAGPDIVKPRDAYAAVRSLAFIYANGVAYGLHHNITRTAIMDAVSVLTTFHKAHGDLTIEVIEGDFQLDGHVTGPAIASMQELAKRLMSIGAQSLTFGQGVAYEELAQLAACLFAGEAVMKEAGGFAGLVQAANMPHIHSTVYTYRRVSADETVVHKDVAAAAASLKPEVQSSIREYLEQEGGANPLKEVTLDNEEVVGFLAGMTAAADEDEHGDAREFVRKATLRLRRLCEGLLSNASNRTQKGRRSLRRMIEAVE